MLYLPNPGAWPVVARDTLNTSAATAKEQTLTVAAANAPLRVIYGTVTIGPQIACVLTSGRNLVILAVWGHGEVDSITALMVDDVLVGTKGITVNHYTGAAGQGIDPTMVAAFAAQKPPVAYTDTLPGICYSVVSVPRGASDGFPRLTATIKGRKVYDPRQNLLPYSEYFQGWSRARTTIDTLGYVAPDGSATADKLCEDSQTGGHYTYRTCAFTAGVTYTGSIFVHAAERSKGAMQLGNGVVSFNGGVAICTYDLLAKTAVKGTYGLDCGIIEYPDGWFRVWLSATCDNTGSDSFFCTFLSNGTTISYTGTVGYGIYLWGGQLNTGATPTAYTPSVVTWTGRSSIGTYYNNLGQLAVAGSGVARYSYNPANLLAPSKLLLESASINLLTYSEQLWDTANWGVGATLADFFTVTSSTAISDPYGGVQPVAKFVTSAAPDSLFLRKFISLTAAATYVASIYVFVPTQAGVSSWEILCDFGDIESGGYVSFTTFDKWVRVVSPASTIAASRSFVDFNIYSNVVTSSPGFVFYATAAQLEASIYATSYIPTTTAAVTRSADTSTSAAVNPVTAYTDNPALCLGDFITNTAYGMGRTVDYDSVGAVANDCDVLVGGVEKLRTLNLCLDTVQPVTSWLETLRTYAACWVTQSDAGLRLISDKAGDIAASYTHASGQILSISNLKKRGVQSMPTVMTVTYRDVSATPPRDGTATVLAAGVITGATPRRESAVSLPGINRYSQAWREATERLNKLTLNDLSFTLNVFDEGLAVEVGDIISVTHPIGLTDKPMRVLGVTGEYGRYTLDLLEYDPAVYDSSVAGSPSYADTSTENPATPVAVTDVTMTEEVFQQQNGTYSSRWRVAWLADEYAYLAYYRAELWAGATLIHSASITDGEQWPTPAVQEGVIYTAKVASVSTIGATSDYATQSATAAGKLLLPGNVPSISAFEAGGRVYITWLPAADIDVWRYEVRWGVVGGTWETSTLLDRVDALRLQVDQLPVGTWTLYVKCIDSVGGYSVTAASGNVAVTSDASAFLINTFEQTAPTLTGMAEYSLHPTDANRYFVTEDSVAFGTKYSAALSTYTNPLASYHTSQTSTWLGEAEDFGLDLGGQLTGTATVADLSGTHTSYIGTALAAAPTTWTYDAGLSQKKNARFVRMKHEALTTGTLLVTIPTQTIRLDAIPREEVGSATSSASGPVTITLENSYVFVKKLTITPQGTTARSCTFDNVVLGAISRFDVYIFNDAGSRIASPFQWQFQGV